MESDPASMAARKHTNGWMTVLALGLLAVWFARLPVCPDRISG